MHYDILIVGGGHGGAQAAIALRQAKFEGSIAIVNAEPEYPYERPPLSKDYFAGDKAFERIMIRPAAFWAERSVDMLLGQRVETVDAAAHSVTTSDGTVISYGHMIWATGGDPRQLPVTGGNLRGVHVVRTRADVDHMVEGLDDVADVVIVGGGYIGLEAAAVLRKMGKKVTVLEAMDRVLARVAGEPLSRFYEAEHRAHGVDLRLNVEIAAIEGDEYVTGVRLADGEVVAQFRLRNVDVRRCVLLAAVAPREVPVFVLVDRLVKLAGHCIGCWGGIGCWSGCLRHQDALRQTGLASAQRQKSDQQAASEKGCVHGGGVGARCGGAQRGAHAKDLYFRRAPFGARQPPWNQVFRTRRSSSRIRQMAPTEIAQSATLKDGKCMPFQWKSRKSTT